MGGAKFYRIDIVNIDKERLGKIGWFAGLALASSAFFLPIINPDIFWHFAAARYMAGHLSVPRTDFLTWTMQGREWVDFEWLSQLILYSLYKSGGFKLLVAFKGALLTAVTVVSWRTAAMGVRTPEPGITSQENAASPRTLAGFRKKCEGWLYMPFFAAGIIVASDLRPENFSLLFFALLLYRLELDRAAGGTDFTLRDGALAAVFFALWTNLHAGYLYGLVLVLIYFLGGFCGAALPFVYGKSSGLQPGRYSAYLKYAGIGLAASLINPYGWKIYGVILNHQKYLSLMQEYIQEWGTFDLTNVYHRPYVVTLAGVFALLLWRFIKTRELVFEHFGALLFFAWASSNHTRHIPFFMMTALPYSAGLFGGKSSESVKKYPLYALRAAALAAIVWHYNSAIWPQYTGRSTLFSVQSEGLSDFLHANKDRLAGLRLFNYWGWGGFLEYKLSPDYKAFIDGRYLFHEKLEEAVGLGSDLERWKAFIDKYKFDLMLIKLDAVRIPLKQRLPSGREVVFRRPAYLFYLPRKEWAVIYWDYRVAAVVRRSAVPAAWLSEREYRYFRPADSGNIVLPVLEGEIRVSDLEKEIRRYLKNNTAYYEDSSVTAEVLNYQAAIETLCKDKNAKCRQ